MSDAAESLDSARTVPILGSGVRIRVQGAGEPLLLINGLTRPLESWDLVTEELMDRQIISFDVPGIGGSANPSWPQSIPSLADVAAAILDETGVERADVLGYSHGGAIAQQMAFQSPERVRSLILVSTSCGFGSTVRGVDALAVGASSGPEWPLVDSVGVIWNSLAIASWSSIAFLGSISAPTLVITGEHDRVVHHMNSAMLARRIPGASLVKLSAGHDLQKAMHAKALARVVTTFLLTVPSASV